MSIRRNLLVIAATMLFVFALSGCMAGESMMAGSDVEISIDEALAGQDAVMHGAMAGAVTLSDSQASSLLTELLKQNGLNKVEIAGISADMDGDMNMISIDLASPVGGIDSLGVSASIVSSGGVLSVDLDNAWAGGMGVDGALLDMISAQLNANLAGMPLGLPDGPVGISGDQAAMVSMMMSQMGLNSVELSAVKTHFADGHIGIMGELASPVAGVDSLGVSAAVSVDGGAASIHVQEAFAGNMVADSGLTGMIADQINAQLSAIPLPPVSIDANGGELTVALSQ